MSRFGALEYFAETRAQVLVPGTFAFAKATSARGFWERDSSNQYPQLFLSADPAVPIESQVNASFANIEYEQELFVRISVNSDGLSIGDARQRALEMLDLVVDTLIKQVPDNLPQGAMPGALTPLQAFFAEIDVGICTVIQPFKVKFNCAW